MTESEFLSLLQHCTRVCLEVSRPYVIEDLPDVVIYQVRPNQSYDGNPLHPDEVVYPKDVLPGGAKRMTASEAVKYLWRDGRVPEWIDIIVTDVDSSATVVDLVCCGRFTSNPKLWYYNSRGQGPFGIKGPYLPPDYDEGGGKKFSVRWRTQPKKLGGSSLRNLILRVWRKS